MGIQALRKIQIGKEATKGTAVAATAALLGTLTMKSNPTIHRPEEERAQMARYSRGVKAANLAELSFEGDATYEQILYLLHMGVLGNVTPSVVDTSARLWTFTPAMTAAGVYNSFTIEHGDDIQEWEVEHCMASEIEISAAMNDVAKVKATIFGRKMSATSFTGGLSPPTVEAIPGQMFKLYIDNEDISMGYTVKANSLISFSYKIITGLYPKRYGDGSLDFTTYGETFKDVELKATFAFNSGAEAERLLYDGNTMRLIRIKSEGTLVGSVTALKNLSLDMCGVYTDFSTLEDRDGEDVVTVTLKGQRGTNYTKLFEILTQSAVTALP